MMFEDRDNHDNPEFRKRCLEKAMVVLRECCQEIAGGGELPDSFTDRLRLLFTGVAQVSALSLKWAAEEVGDPDLLEGPNREAVARAIGDVITCAVIVAERFSHDRTAAPEFSSN